MSNEQGRFIGKQVEFYNIGRKIGGGGMGEVYEGNLSLHQNSLVAIKFLIQEGGRRLTDKHIEQFRKEAHTHSKLIHPHILKFFQFNQFEEDGEQIPYIVMEYMPEGSAGGLLRRQPILPVNESMSILLQTLSALQYAHEQNVLHRDLKPDNFLLEREVLSKQLIAKLADFGITATAHRLDTERAVTEQVPAGTLQYMSPEQFKADARIPSDIYAFGVITYQFLTGQVPFKIDPSGHDRISLLIAYHEAHKSAPVPPILETRKNNRQNLNLPQDTEERFVDAVTGVVEKALQKEPKDRYQSAGDMMQELEQTYARTKEQAKRNIYYSLSEQLRIRGVNSQTIVDPFLPLDAQINQLHEAVLQRIQQELTSYQRQNQALTGENQLLRNQLAQKTAEEQRNRQLQQEIVEVRQQLQTEQQKNSGLQDALVRKEEIMEEMGEKLDKLEAEKDALVKQPEVRVDGIIAAMNPQSEQTPDVLRAQELVKECKDLYDQKRYPEVSEASEQATKLDPNNAEAWLFKGLSMCTYDKYEEAIPFYDRVIQLDPKHYVAIWNKANCLNKLNRYKEALPLLEKALQLDPIYAEAWFDKGNALNALGMKEEAIAAYDQAIRLNPGYSNAYNNKGIVLYILHRNKEAIAAYDQAIRLNPGDSNAFAVKGAALCELGKYREASECFQQAMACNPPEHIVRFIDQQKKQYKIS